MGKISVDKTSGRDFFSPQSWTLMITFCEPSEHRWFSAYEGVKYETEALVHLVVKSIIQKYFTV